MLESRRGWGNIFINSQCVLVVCASIYCGKFQHPPQIFHKIFYSKHKTEVYGALFLVQKRLICSWQHLFKYCREILCLIPCSINYLILSWSWHIFPFRFTSKASLAHTGILWDTVRHLTFACSSVKAWRAMAWVQVLAQWSNVPGPAPGGLSMKNME